MRKSLEGLYGVEKDHYWGLPRELEDYNYYLNDGETGHVIMAVPECLLANETEKTDLDMWECPFPVRYVLEKGYRMYKNHVICDGKYDSFLGLQIDRKYYETYWEPEKKNNDTELEVFSVGQVIPEFKGRSEGVMFDLTDAGALMVVFFNSPTESEVKQFDTDSPFEIRFMSIWNVIMLTVKIGNLNWMDAPYSVHLSQNLTIMPVIDDGNGIGLTLMLVDCRTGEIKSIRLLGLSTKFSAELCKEIDKQRETSFNRTEYDLTLGRLYAVYPTKKIVQMSNKYCRIN